MLFSPTWIRRALEDAGRARRAGAPRWHRQLLEILWFRWRAGIARNEYYFYELYDRARPIADRLATIGRNDRLFLEHRIASRETRQRVGGKLRGKLAYLNAGLPTPGLVGWFDPADEDDVGLAHRVQTRQELAEALSDPPASGIVCKLEIGYGGQGLMAFPAADSQGLIDMRGEKWSIDRLYDHFTQSGVRWLLEERVRPHPALVALHGEDLGTVRLHSLHFRSGRVELCAPIFRLPVGNTGVDNLTAGNLGAAVDLETGVLGSATDIVGGGWVDHHPVTQRRITGTALPMWSEVKDLARRAAAAFPDVTAVGWDIAVTASGPVVIEMNPSWGMVIQRIRREGMIKGPMREWLVDAGAARILRRRS